MAHRYRFNPSTREFEDRRPVVATVPEDTQGERRRHGRAPRPRTRYFDLAGEEEFVGWDVQDVSADVALYSKIVRLVSRARDLERGNDYIKSFLRLFKSNVIGPNGFKFTACRKAANGRVDKTFNRDFEHAWKQAGKLKHSPSVCGRLTRLDVLNMIAARFVVDGEALLHHRRGFDGNKWRYGVAVIDSMRLDWQLNGHLENGRRIKMGVEVDDDDRPLAYHILTQHPSESLFGFSLRQPERVRIPAEQITHIFSVERPGQTRGVTWLAAPGLRARMLDKFEEAVVVGSRIAASKMGFYRPGEEYDPEDVPGEEDNEGSLKQEAEPGMFELLPKGIDGLETFDPAYPPANLEEFHKTMARGIAAGLGANYNAVFQNFEGVNYSSLREAKLLDRDAWRTLQTFFVEHVLEPWFRQWADFQTLNNDAGFNTGKHAGKVEAMLEADCYRFSGRGWQWVDPLKEVKAHKESIAAGFTSPQRVIEEISGDDPEDILEEIAAFEGAAKAKGVQVQYVQGTLALPDGDPGDDEKGEDD